MIASFIICLFIFVIIGILSTLKNRHSTSDYLLASYSVKPWLVGLSAAASNNSGYMFIGMIGFTYLYGISSLWLIFGWIAGDLVSSLLIHKKLRITAKAREVLSFAGAVSKWNGRSYKKLRAYLGVITVIFLVVYAAAQLNAGSKALNVLLGWDYEAGAIIGAIIVLLYCFAGGIRASIWTDAAQSFVMIFAMAILCVVSIDEAGGMADFIAKVVNVSPGYTNFFPEDLALKSSLGAFLFAVTGLILGFGVVGQPHIMTRFMAMDDPESMTRIRTYYYSYYLIFSILTFVAGISARILLPDVASFDSEVALPTLASSILPEVLVGVILAGIFAATMSTADSQILSCTAVITRDLTDKKPSYIFTKLATVFITVAALLIALYGVKSVFTLVIIAWSALACTFTPLLLILILGQKPSEALSIIVAVTGLASMLIWQYAGLDKYVAEVAPGIFFGIAVYFLLKPMMKKT